MSSMDHMNEVGPGSPATDRARVARDGLAAVAITLLAAALIALLVSQIV